MSLPDDPFENERTGSSFLRLTNECPPGGIVFRIDKFSKAKNTQFKDRDHPEGKDEYHFEGIHFTPTPIHRTITESSAGFTTALKDLGYKSIEELYGKVLHISWVKEQISPSKSIKYWTITEVDLNDAELFPT